VQLSPDAWLGGWLILGSIRLRLLACYSTSDRGNVYKNLVGDRYDDDRGRRLLAVAEFCRKKRTFYGTASISDALAVGFAQVLALIPGSSRSGSTIMGGLFAGLTRGNGRQVFFLTVDPGIAASGVLD